MRLTSLADVPNGQRPGYDPAAHGVGIVHLGLGAFHKAHQAAMTDTAIAAKGGDWRITGVSLRSRAPSRDLGAQNGLYTLIERGAEGSRARVVAAIARALCSAGDPEAALASLSDSSCRVVTLTVTEKAYGLDRAKHECDPAHPAVCADLERPEMPQGVLGLLVRALHRRKVLALPPFAVLCCDNLPDNGPLLRGAVVDFARRIDAPLADWIAERVAFPATMVDRITPAPTEATYAEARRLTGLEDRAAVETEPFCQWVIEDAFPLGRPAWDEAGALFVGDVRPYEAMKLRMLNGSHSMLAYAGFHAGLALVRDAVAEPHLAALVRRHLAAAAATLPDLRGIDLSDYAEDLEARFANPAIAHETFQIAMDGTEKLPQRIFAPALDAIDRGQPLRPFAFATAAWLRHASGATHDCAPYEVRDPRADEIRTAITGLGDPGAMVDAVMAMPGFAPQALAGQPAWRTQVAEILSATLSKPMAAVIRTEAAALRVSPTPMVPLCRSGAVRPSLRRRDGPRRPI